MERKSAATSTAEKQYPNHFEHGLAAHGYTQARPYFHPQVMEHMRGYLLECHAYSTASFPLECGLDVGCGTGQSTRALALLAKRVVGMDPSLAMLREVEPQPGMVTLAARAEYLPFAGAQFDIISVALAFHWIKRAHFLPEAYRVLKPGGIVFIYNNGFHGRMLDDPAFCRWNEERFLKSIPIPPRYRYPLKDSQVERAGLAFLARENYENAVHFDRPGLADYLLSQSNVIARAAGGEESRESMRARLLEELRPLFPAGGQEASREFLFGGTIWILQKPWTIA